MDKISSDRDKILIFLLNYYSLNSKTSKIKNFDMLQRFGVFTNPDEVSKNLERIDYSEIQLEHVLDKCDNVISNYNTNYIGNHQIVENIGSGSFGYIFRTYNRIDNHSYALKVIKLESSFEDNQKIIDECSIMAELDHPNIIRYYSSWFEKNTENDMNLYIEDSYDSDNYSDDSIDSKIVKYDRDEFDMYLFIQMELCSKDLSYYIQNRTNINYNEIVDIYTQIVLGLDYLHSKNIIHRDIKPSNIFLTEQNKIKIGDFGMSKKINNITDNILKGSDEYGTNNYLAPEVIEHNKYSKYSDIYGIGIILYELLTIFKTNMERYLNLKQLRELNLDSAFLIMYKKESQFICKLLDKNPKQRMDTQQILNLKNIIKE